MLNLFNSISKVGSPRAKVQLLLQYPQQNELKTVLRYATDPFITFGITDFEEKEGAVGDPYYILERLSRRELTGAEAKDLLGTEVGDHPEDREIIRRILRKDLRCGVGEKLVQSAYPGLIRSFSVMRASKFEKMPRGKCFIEKKIDGLRCIAIVEGQSVTLLSRNGREFTSSDHLKPQILRMAQRVGDCVFDGELTSGNFNESSSAVRRKNDQNDSTVYNVFDFLSMEEWKNPRDPYYVRRGRLEDLFQTDTHLHLVPSYEVSSEEDAFRYYEHFRALGFEGAIIKSSGGTYQFKRSNYWLKLKAVEDVDLKVEKLIQGEGKYHGMLGAVIVTFKGKRVNVGSGFSDEERREFWDNPNLILHKVIEIQYHEVTPDGSLRHPRFVKIREDKSA